MTINWQIVAPILAASAVALNAVLVVVIAKWPNAPTWLKVLQGILADLVPNLAAQQTRAALTKPVIGSPVKVAK